jgi:ribosomal protein S13
MNIEKIISDYKALGNIWKVGDINGVSGQKIHNILKKNGIDTTKKNKWTEQQINELIEIYNSDFNFGTDVLNEFCKKHNKLKSNVCRKARLLGLATNRHRFLSKELKHKISINAKNWIKEKGHPKGFLNHNHTKEAKELMSESSIKMWKNPNSIVNTEEHRQKLSDRFSSIMNKRLSDTSGNIYSKSKKGTIEIGGKKVFCRSTWEANICAYFQFLKDNGEIKDWDLEVKTFWFEKIKRGVRSYKPDFFITNNDGSQYFEEVKGYMDSKSKTKIKRMAKYYPEVDLRILDQKRYKEISKMSSIIPNWGLLS